MSDSSPAQPSAESAPARAAGARFGIFEVDFETGELRKRGLRVRLQGQPFRVLSLLLEQPGRVVTREELLSKLWPGDTFVDFDHGLNTAINKIRQALGDSAANPRFVETMHRRGYRFIAPVERVGGAPQASADSHEPATSIARRVTEGPPEPTPGTPAYGGTAARRTEPASDNVEPAAGAGGPLMSAVPEAAPVEASAGGRNVAAGQTTGEDVVRTFGAWVQAKLSALAERARRRAADKEAEQKPAQEGDFPPFGAWLRIGGLAVFGVSIALAIATVAMVFGLVQDRLARFFGPDRSPLAAVSEIRILAGQSSDHTNGLRQRWLGDQLYVGGETSQREDVVIGASDPFLFHGERYGSFQYVIPAAPGKYRLTLHFAEFWFGPGNQGGGGPGSRVFDVECNGVKLISDFDVFRAAGGARRAMARSFEGIAPNDQGNVVVTFLPQVDNAMVNAIELMVED